MILFIAKPIDAASSSRNEIQPMRNKTRITIKRQRRQFLMTTIQATSNIFSYAPPEFESSVDRSVDTGFLECVERSTSDRRVYVELMNEKGS